jgi:hypothetical protein
MNSKCSLRACAAAALLCGSVYSQEKENTIQTEENETSLGDFVSAEVSVSFDSKFVSYGLIDNKDPIITPSAHLTFVDFLTFGVAAIYDTTTYGRKAGYSNRGGRYTELDPEVSIGYSFSPEDFSWLPTTIDVSFGYIYEYHPRSMGGGSGEPGDDTQFMFTEICLHDLILEPIFQEITVEYNFNNLCDLYEINISHNQKFIKPFDRFSLIFLRLACANRSD